MLDHCLMPLRHLLVVLKIDELLERAQVLVELALDVRLSCGEVSLVSVFELGKSKVRFDLVNGLFD